MANRAAHLLFGYEAGALEKQNVAMLMPPPFSQQHDSYLQAYMNYGKGSYQASWQNRTWEIQPLCQAAGLCKENFDCTSRARLFLVLITSAVQAVMFASLCRQAQDLRHSASSDRPAC